MSSIASSAWSIMIQMVPWSSQPLNLAPLSVTEAGLAASKTSIHMNWVWWSIDQTCSKQKLCTGAWISIGLHWSAPHFQIVPNYCFLYKKTNGFWECVGTIDIFFDPQKWSQQWKLVAFIWFQSISTWETIFFKKMVKWRRPSANQWKYIVKWVSKFLSRCATLPDNV